MDIQKREAIITEYVDDLETQLLRARLDVIANEHNPHAQHKELSEKVRLIEQAIADVRCKALDLRNDALTPKSAR
ncbi:MAG: hypothetical protein LC754_10390 [Acidobacteria bacterium]|nr:hypothetical protein [Acidobacteriota bacterium]